MNLHKKQSLTGSNVAQTRTIQILQDENSKLRNEINELRVEHGSSELVNSYKVQVKELNSRILELEKDKSNLSAELLNLRNEMEIKMQAQDISKMVDAKRSITPTTYGNSGQKTMTSPDSKIERGSTFASPKEEDIKIPLVDSKYEASSASNVKTYDNRRTT